jgi:hypothetical protein
MVAWNTGYRSGAPARQAPRISWLGRDVLSVPAEDVMLAGGDYIGVLFSGQVQFALCHVIDGKAIYRELLDE